VSGSFLTSKAYADEPVKAVDDFIAANAIEKDNGQVWALADREETYRSPELTVGERPKAGWTALFPHPITGRAGADAQFYERWQKSPFSDVAVGHIYLAPGIFTRLTASPGVVNAVDRALLTMPGVARVLRSDRLSASSSDRAVRAAALGFVAGRSGDSILVARPYWVLELRADADATTHGTMYSYDRRVPMFFLGGGIRRGQFSGRVSPADIAPTLAHLSGIPLPPAEGRVLREALTSGVSRPKD
jgi:hypothetical protein